MLPMRPSFAGRVSGGMGSSSRCVSRAKYGYHTCQRQDQEVDSRDRTKRFTERPDQEIHSKTGPRDSLRDRSKRFTERPDQEIQRPGQLLKVRVSREVWVPLLPETGPRDLLPVNLVRKDIHIKNFLAMKVTTQHDLC